MSHTEMPIVVRGILIFCSMLTLLVALFGCGRSTCTYSVVESRTLQMGPNEVLHCPDTEVILSATPAYLPGGLVTHINVKCGRLLTECK